MEADDDEEERLLRSAALQNAQSIHLARQRTEDELIEAKEDLEQKTQELAHSLAMMRATLESTTDGILATDNNGRVTGFNEKYAQMWRLSREVMDQKDHRKFLQITSQYFQNAAEYLARAEEIYATGPPESYDLLELADGRVFERYSRIQFVEGKNVGRVWSLRDITQRRQAEASLAKQSEWLRVTLASIGDAVIATDTEGRVTFLNAIAESLTAWPGSEAVGQPLETVFHIVNESTRLPVENPAQRAVREGVIVGLANHTILIAKDGVECPIDDSAAPIRDSAGQIAGAVLVFRDVTAQRRAERELLERAVLSAFQAELGLVLTHSDSVTAMLQRCTETMVQHLNGAFARIWTLNERTNILELQASSGIYKHLDGPHSRIPVGRYKIGMIARLRQPTLTNHVQGDDRIHDQAWAKREGMVAFAGYPLMVESRLIGVVAIFARHVLSEAALQAIGSVASSIALAIEQKRQANELRSVAAELSEADRRKNEFLAMLAHELRNPLAPIRNALRIVRLTEGHSDEIQNASEMMERQVNQMVHLVDDLLDISRISRGKIDLRLSRVDLTTVISQAVETCRPAIEAARHTLRLEIPRETIPLHADPVRLAQVFSNLLNNACKYSEPEARIAITAERQGMEVVVRVTDTGLGISREMLPKVFEMFTQVDRSLERSQGGLGIGLTLVQRLVEMHKGTVSAFSEGLRKGSEFVVRLPIAVEDTTERPPAKSKIAMARPTKGRRILVVDDNRDSALTLAMLLKLTGNDTRTAHDGLEAVAVAEAFRPEVVLLDIGLPKLNGYEAARRIREQAWGKRMVLVALTGWGQDEDRRKSHEAGFNRHMVKPVDHADLMALLAEELPAEPNAL